MAKQQKFLLEYAILFLLVGLIFGYLAGYKTTTPSAHVVVESSLGATLNTIDKDLSNVASTKKAIAQPRVGDTALSGCQDIFAPGRYTIVSDINAPAGKSLCIGIYSPDVTLDCSGRTIRGNPSTKNSVGVAVFKTNVNVRNCEIKRFFSGLWITGAGSRYEISRNKINSNSAGIVIKNSQNNPDYDSKSGLLSNNVVINNDLAGIYLEANGFQLNSNHVCGNSYSSSNGDIFVKQGFSATGDLNRCDSTVNYEDTHKSITSEGCRILC